MAVVIAPPLNLYIYYIYPYIIYELKAAAFYGQSRNAQKCLQAAGKSLGGSSHLALGEK